MTTATGVCDDLERRTTAARDMANNVAARKKELADTIEASTSAARSNQRAVDDVKHTFNQAKDLVKQARDLSTSAIDTRHAATQAFDKFHASIRDTENSIDNRFNLIDDKTRDFATASAKYTEAAALATSLSADASTAQQAVNEVASHVARSEELAKRAEDAAAEVTNFVLGTADGTGDTAKDKAVASIAADAERRVNECVNSHMLNLGVHTKISVDKH